MLRIKETEWKRFCDNAEKLEYKLNKEKDAYVYNSNSMLCKIDIEDKQIFVIVKGLMSAYEVLDRIYELIQQDYVEKVGD